jgi:hypothetical protein
MTLLVVSRQLVVRMTHNSPYKRAVTVCFTWCPAYIGLTKFAYGLRRKREKIRPFEAALRKAAKYQESCQHFSDIRMKLSMIFLVMGHNQNKVQGLYAHDQGYFSAEITPCRRPKTSETVSIRDQANLCSNSRYRSNEILLLPPLDVYRNL